MMSLKRIFGLMMLFLFFETAVAVVSLLWFRDTNPLLACAAMTALALAVWLCLVFITRLLAKQRAATVAVERPPTPQKPVLVDDSFSQELKSLIAEANRRLEGMLPVSKGQPQPTVSTLPLYLLIGPEGVGKTTLMVNSGLEPRLLAGEGARDGSVAPTRLANLWLAEGAIFAEVSGRVLMQDPDHWEKALRLLSLRHRIPLWRRMLHGDSSQPDLRGVLLACDTGQFLRSNDLQRLGPLARTLNERLAAVNSVYRKEVPVYVLLTQSDAVQYFAEFFAHLSEAESRRPLGAILPSSLPEAETAEVYSDREGRRLTGFFNRLYQSLADKRMNLLAREEDANKRALAYEFPRELKKLRGDVVQFLLDTFRPATLDPGFRLRGFFFCGRRMVARGDIGLEAMTVTDSIVRRPAEATVFFGNRADTAKQDRSTFVRRTYSPTVARWVFLTELMRDLILEDPAGRTAPMVATRDTTYRTLAFAGAGALCLLFSLIWVNSWRNNYKLLHDVQVGIDATPLVQPPTGPRAVQDLEAMRPVLVRLHEYARSGPPPGYGWGLYAGTPVRQALDRLYFTRFRSALLHPLLTAMTERLEALDPAAPTGTDVHALVKSYRSMTSGTCAPDPAVLNQTVYPLWRTVASPEPSTAVVADRQIGFYLAELATADPYARLGDPIPEDHNAVTHAQMYLQNLGGPEKIYHALLNQVDSKGSPDHLSDVAGDYGQVLTGPNEIEQAFTTQGWATLQENLHSHKLVSPGDPCVVGSSAGVTSWGSDNATEARVGLLYSNAYIQHWKDFLSAHHVVPFNGTTDASQKLRVLADNNRSPLLALLYVTSANTNVAPPQTMSDQLSTTFREVTKGTQESVRGFIVKWSGHKDSPASSASSGTPVAPAPATVRGEFAPVRAMVDPGSREKWLNEKNSGYMKSLEELSTALAALPPRVNSDVPTEVAALEHAKSSVAEANMELHTLEGFFPNTPQGVDVVLRNLLREPINDAERTVREVAVVNPPPVVPTGAPAALVTPPPPPPHDLAKPVIDAINVSGHDLCAAITTVGAKYPFDGTAAQEASLDDLDSVFSSSTGALTRFATSPDVSKAYAHAGKLWTAKADFPATFSQPFLNELNNLGQISDAFYAEGGSHAHVEYTITLDGTGKIPFELDVDGHTIKYTPGKPGVPTRLVWPPLTNAPTRLVAHTGSKGGFLLPVQSAGLWSLFRLLQAANDQSGNVFTFRGIEFAHSYIPLMNEKGTPGTLQIRVDSPAGNIFGRGYFGRLRCESSWALR